MRKIYIKEDTSVNWMMQYNVHALNMSTKQFENVNEFCGDDNIVINILEDNNYFGYYINQDEITKEIQKIEFDGYNRIEFLLFYNYSLVGYVEKIDGFGL